MGKGLTMRKLMILSLLLSLGMVTQAQHSYCIWIDGQTEQMLSGDMTKAAHLDLDVSALDNGLHQLYVAVIDDAGTPLDQQARIFVKTSTDEALRYIYWFDDDQEHTTTGDIMTSKHFVADVSELPSGIHTFNLALTDLSGSIVDQQSTLFVRVPNGGIVRYEYFINSLDTPVGGETLAKPTLPFLLMADLDVSGVPAAPLRSDNFYFCIEDNSPYIMSKNDIFFRFYLEDYTYIEVGAQYADASTAEAVVAELLEDKQTVRRDVPAANAISWYKAEAEKGDSLLFRISTDATMQLFGPDGTELASTDKRELRLRTSDSGTCYLAVHDADSNVPAQMDIYFERVDGMSGINHIKMSPQNNDNAVFDLNGRRIASPKRKGIYIIGRRKVIQPLN